MQRPSLPGNRPPNGLRSLLLVQEWLHWAAYEGQEALVRVLLGKPGVRPDAVGEEGVTPLHLAAHANSVSMVGRGGAERRMGGAFRGGAHHASLSHGRVLPYMRCRCGEGRNETHVVASVTAEARDRG